MRTLLGASYKNYSIGRCQRQACLVAEHNDSLYDDFTMNHSELTLLIVAVIALVAAGFANWQLYKFNSKNKTFFAGKEAANLEDFIINQNARINDLAKQNNLIEQAIKDLREQQKLSIQKIGLVRYNHFNENGGNLSFSAALLDSHNNGIVITSMHGREQNRIYSKPIAKGKSEFTLTAEEQQAINESKNN